MDWKWLFIGFDGRISRRQFWIGTLILIVVGLLVFFFVGPLVGVSMFAGFDMMSMEGGFDAEAFQAGMSRASWFSLVMFVIFLWPSAALLIKRRHDRGSSGIEVWVFYGLQALSTLLAALGLTMAMTDIGGFVVPQQNVLGISLGAVVGIFAIYLIVVCGFLKGNEGDNLYGPDPLD